MPSTPELLRGKVAGRRSSRTVVKLAALAAVVTAAMFYRRPDQLRHPYVWVEDGTYNLVQFADLGWAFVFQPIVGYFSLPIRTIFGTSAWLSFRWLPEISVALTLLLTYGVLAAIALSPTVLRHRFWCAAMVMFVPSSSEVFGVSLYTGWWGSLLAFLPLFWRDTPKVAARSALLVIGGLSTPVAIGLLPLYAGRLYLYRRRSELWIVVLCAVLAAVQAAALLQNPTPVNGTLTWLSVPTVIEKFFGHYVFWTPRFPTSPVYLALGLAVSALISVSLYLRRPLSWLHVCLAGCLLIAIALSAARVPAEAMHAVLAGGRYFFLPYVMLSWLFINLLDRRFLTTSALSAAAMLMSVGMAAAHGQRTHRAIDWRAQIESCLAADTHTFPIHYEGDAWHGIMWSVTLTREQCTRLVEGSVLDNGVAAR